MTGDTPRSRYKWAHPWLVKGAVAWMEAFLRPEFRVFEWGSGGSTVWFAQRVAEVVTVEHQPKWAAALREMNLGNVKIIERPDDYPDFHGYAGAIDDEDLFDLILIDGADGYDGGMAGSRGRCTDHAPLHLRPGGAIVLDNSGSASNVWAVTLLQSVWGGVHDQHTYVGTVLEPPGHEREGKDITETTIFVSPEKP